MRWLLDTCVLSEFAKPSPDPRIVEWLRAQSDADLALSVLTIGEIEKGIHRLPESAKKRRLSDWLSTGIVRRFEDRILPIDIHVARQWALSQAQAEMKGRPVAAIGGLLAATALVHRLTLVTRDHSDMEATGVSLLNPWSIER